MIFDLVLIGLAITLEPIPLTAFILILASKGGTKKGAAFIFGWILSLAIVVAGTLLVTENKPPQPSSAPSLAALAVKMAIGAVLVVIAVRQYRKIGKPRPPKKGSSERSPRLAWPATPRRRPLRRLCGRRRLQSWRTSSPPRRQSIE